MKKKTILTTIVAFLLLVAVIAAGLNAVFTVTYVNASFVTYTPEGERAAQQLKEQLNSYLGKSTTFLDLAEVRATAQSDPRFRVVSVEKQYPASVIVGVEERRAAFALASPDGWDVFDGDGIRIGTDTSGERYTILADGFSFTVSEGELCGAYREEVLAVYAVLRELLGEPCANILSIALEDNSATGSLAYDRFRLATREGVEIAIREPSVSVEEKTRAAVETYLSLDEGERVRGRISAVMQEDGNIVAEYIADL